MFELLEKLLEQAKELETDKVVMLSVVVVALAIVNKEGPCCTIPKQDGLSPSADFAQLTCCRTGIPNPVILLIAFTHASASPTCAL